MCISPSFCFSFAKPTAVDKLKHMDKDKNKRRHSVSDVDILQKSSDRRGRQSLPSANDSLDTSLGLNDSVSSQKRKESRSERHKRVIFVALGNGLSYPY